MFSKYFSPSPKIILLCYLLCIPAIGFGRSFWKPVANIIAPTKGERTIIPVRYKTFQLNQKEVITFLNNLTEDPSQAKTIMLPSPTGKEVAFKIWKTPVLPPALQKRYSGILTFTGTAENNPYISAKIDYTVFGLHAMVYAPGKVWMIEPYSHQPDGYYISFYQSDAPANNKNRMVCEWNENQREEAITSGIPTIVPSHAEDSIAKKPSDNTKRTYRLALSCTGEYAQAVGGSNPTKLSVLSAMTTTINRVNGIYEREVDVTLVMIDEEDSLIYLDPATDPFTANNNGGALLGQNQSNTDNVIGKPAYDIGHIFSTGGGGIAWLGSVCDNLRKARGVTGLSNPTGDAFAVDFVAHEMGHQFGANHIFNDCNGNEYWRTAYEPGSGSSIMGYAGICGPQNNIQQHSDDYFHTISLMEISNFLSDDGNTCAATSSLSVSIPSFSPINEVYTIPAATPFELSAPKAITDNAEDSLSYSWEQWNLGNLQETDNGSAYFVSGPVFRSEYPKTNDTLRVFPSLTTLVNNIGNAAGDKLPRVSRDLYFKLTVRNTKNGWGAFQISDDSLTVHVHNTNQPFKVTMPNTAGLQFKPNDTIQVTWLVAGTDNAPINCEKVDIYLSIDGGYTYPYSLATNVDNNGNRTVILPSVTTQHGRIKIKGHDNVFFDISNNDFILDDNIGISENELDNQLSIFPNPATDKIQIKSSYHGEMHASLFNELGQKIWEGNFKGQQLIPVKNLSRGFYLLKCSIPGKDIHTLRKIILK